MSANITGNTIYDKIWLLSAREIDISKSAEEDGAKVEGVGNGKSEYDKFCNTESKYYINLNSGNSTYGATNARKTELTWFLRSPNFLSTTNVCTVKTDGQINDASSVKSSARIALGFCI